MTSRSDSRSELQRLADLQRVCREVQAKHQARMTPRGRKRRKVSRGTQRDML